ncbi:hypothetical protein GCM10020000_01870 [Streptomyces olivoverticillatus]
MNDGIPSYAIVIPTLGRPCLTACLAALAASADPRAGGDRHRRRQPRPRTPLPAARRPGRTPGPDTGAAHRGQRTGRSAQRGLAGPPHPPWAVFLDDDVRVSPRWRTDLAADLADAEPRLAGIQGIIEVPLPQDRRPTDWERNTAGLTAARWATADMAYRTTVLEAVGGFDERFPRAFREDADLALRVLDAGHRLIRGARVTEHPVRPADRWVSLRNQAGNADDALMRRLHGPRWHQRAGAPRGRLPGHAAVTAAGALAAALALGGRRGAAAVAAAAWGARHRRIRPGQDRTGPAHPVRSPHHAGHQRGPPAAGRWPPPARHLAPPPRPAPRPPRPPESVRAVRDLPVTPVHREPPVHGGKEPW